MESGQILHVREIYRKWMLQVTGSYRGQMQDGDHTGGHYITMFAEQLTRTFEVLVKFAFPGKFLQTNRNVTDHHLLTNLPICNLFFVNIVDLFF